MLHSGAKYATKKQKKNILHNYDENVQTTT